MSSQLGLTTSGARGGTGKARIRPYLQCSSLSFGAGGVSLVILAGNMPVSRMRLRRYKDAGLVPAKAWSELRAPGGAEIALDFGKATARA